MRHLIFLFAVFFPGLLSANFSGLFVGEAPDLPAFPAAGGVANGAEGFGAQVTGGRGGDVCKVTNLNNSGAGSFRQCVEVDSGARYVIFDIGGAIVLSSRVDINNGDLTIAGQTAPGDGIELRNDTGNNGPTLAIFTGNIIIRGLKIRPDRTGGNTTALSFSLGARDAIVDHVSMSWGARENITSTDDVSNITVQWSVIAEAIGFDSDPGAGKCVIMGSRFAGRISYHHNLVAHCDERNPRVSAIGDVLDVRYTTFYNWQNRASRLEQKDDTAAGTIQVNYVGNTWKVGGDTTDIGDDDIVDFKAGVVGADAEIYVDGNTFPNVILDATAEPFEVMTEHPTPPMTVSTAAAAFTAVLASTGAGANWRVACDGSLTRPRDVHDQRVVDDTNAGTGTYCTDAADCGGYVTMAAGTPCTDTDGDGMPDAFEDLHAGLDKAVIDGNGDLDFDGYPNFEEYINVSDPTVQN